MQDYAIPQNIVERSKHFVDPLTIIGVVLVFSLIVGLYNTVEVKRLSAKMDALIEAEEDNITALQKLISATEGINEIIDSTAKALTSKIIHETKFFGSINRWRLRRSSSA